MITIASRVQIPFSFNYPSGGNLVPAAGASVAVYIRNADGSQGAPANVYQSQSGTALYQSLITDAGGNVPGWVAEGTYKVIAAASGGFGGGTVNFDALYGGGTAMIAAGVVDVVHFTPNALASLVPAGTMLDFGGPNAPSGYLLCDGSTYGTTQYPNLFNAIGYAHGGSGTTFKVPDSRGKVHVAAGQGTGLINRVLAAIGGEENHALSTAELAAHGHTMTDPGHSHGITDPGHTHPVSLNWTTGRTLVDALGYTLGSGGTAFNFVNPASFLTVTLSSRTTGISVNNITTGISIANAGSGSAHNNMQPFLVVNKIIKY